MSHVTYMTDYPSPADIQVDLLMQACEIMGDAWDYMFSILTIH